MESKASQEPRWIAGIEPSVEVRTQSMLAIYEKECMEQPERLAHLVRAYANDSSILEQMDKLRQLMPAHGPILFVGMGASYCSSVTGSTWLRSCGRSSFFVDAGEWLHSHFLLRTRSRVPFSSPRQERVRNWLSCVKRRNQSRSRWCVTTKKVLAGHWPESGCPFSLDLSMETPPRPTPTRLPLVSHLLLICLGANGKKTPSAYLRSILPTYIAHSASAANSSSSVGEQPI